MSNSIISVETRCLLAPQSAGAVNAPSKISEVEREPVDKARDVTEREFTSGSLIRWCARSADGGDF